MGQRINKSSSFAVSATGRDVYFDGAAMGVIIPLDENPIFFESTGAVPAVTGKELRVTLTSGNTFILESQQGVLPLPPNSHKSFQVSDADTLEASYDAADGLSLRAASGHFTLQFEALTGWSFDLPAFQSIIIQLAPREKRLRVRAGANNTGFVQAMPSAPLILKLGRDAVAEFSLEPGRPQLVAAHGEMRVVEINPAQAMPTFPNPPPRSGMSRIYEPPVSVAR